ncbi:C4-dicarboxylate transporter DctQ subunit [Bacillus oleivorans]|uniref:C4-dicarboxylate transporter DctQ subunit n=1 Tax=Bacillus oleivorans TaxID=1448271 RepID=A0A285CHX4_9BACI|nr:TRAP transporter small permease [Bacillus oleivorans]SNX67109.1 C4-dicarboxylate transporter DctQ subunit [Bacillus oleivorans]
MKGLFSRLDRLEEYILIITFPLMLLFVFAGTIFRYFEIGSLTWAEEAARYLMIWLAFAGIGLGFKKNVHLGLSFFVNKFPTAVQKFLFFVRAAFIILFGGLITYYTSILVSNQMQNTQLSPALGIPIWLVYSAILFGSIMIIIRTVQMATSSIKFNDYSTQEREEVEL